MDMAELITVVGTAGKATGTAGKTAVVVANASAVAVAVADLASQDQDLVADQPAVLIYQFVQSY